MDRSLPVDAAALRYPHFPSLKRSAGLVSIGREPRRDLACARYSGVSWMSARPYHVKSLVAPLLGCRIFHFGNVRCRAPPLGESTAVVVWGNYYILIAQVCASCIYSPLLSARCLDLVLLGNVIQCWSRYHLEHGCLQGCLNRHPLSQFSCYSVRWSKAP